MERSLGMVEVIGFIPAITAADGGLKAADVTLWQVMKADGGIVTVCFSGDVSAVQSAVDAAAMSVDTLGCELRAVHVIARMHEQTAQMLHDSLKPIIPAKISPQKIETAAADEAEAIPSLTKTADNLPAVTVVPTTVEETTKSMPPKNRSRRRKNTTAQETDAGLEEN